MQLLGGDHRETFGKVKPHLVTENRYRASTRAVFLVCADVAHHSHQIEILLHAVSCSSESCLGQHSQVQAARQAVQTQVDRAADFALFA